MAISHKDMLKQSWSQLNDKGSWLFTHIANTLLDTKIKKMGGAGTTGDTTLRAELAWLADNFKALHSLNDRFGAGKAGVRFDGELFGMLRRTEATSVTNAATIDNLVTALAKVSGGEKFDEAKLLAGISAATKAAFDDALKAAAPAEVTLKVEGETK